MNKEIIKSLESLGVDIGEGFIQEKSIIDFSGKKHTIKVKSDLEKGLAIGEGIGENRETNLPIVKTGKEIKEKLSEIKTSQQNEASVFLTKMQILLSKISSSPMRLIDRYNVSRSKLSVESLPKIYSCDQIYPSSGKEIQIQTSARDPLITPNIPTSLSEGEREFANQYNDTVYNYIKCLKEISYIGTFIEGLEDNKKYNLTITQANSFGF